MTNLENDILRYQEAYYNGNELISDTEYDKLWERLEKEQPNSELLSKIGEDTVKNNKIKHIMVMGSQSKFNTEEGFRKWISSENIQFPIICEDKVDGNSLELQYEHGKLKYAVTRGNGYIGEDVTRVARGIDRIPNVIEEFTGAIRGEIVMNKDIFEAKYNEFKNPRNLVAGLMKNENFHDFNDMRFLAYDTTKEFSTELEKMNWLHDKFETPEYVSFLDAESLLFYRNNMTPRDRVYAIDGLVLKQNIIDENDKEELRPKKSHAFKWIDEGEETILVDVEWSMQGSTLTPVAILEPIELEGTTVQRASLANPSLIKEMNLKIGDRVFVTKRGQIIPKIENVVEHCGTVDIEIPSVCPVCGERLVLRENETKLYCNNEKCLSRVSSRLSKWIGITEAKGFGGVFQEALVNEYNLRKITDLYDDSFIKTVCDNYYSINAQKAFIDLKSKRNITLAKFIAGFDIEGIGIEMSKILVDNGYTLDTLKTATVSDLESLPNWSTIRATNFLEGFNKCYEEMKELSKIVTIVDEIHKKSQNGLRICVTGKLNTFTRKTVNLFLEKNGCIPVNSVNASTDILVTNDPNSGSSKNKNAIKYGTKIISEEDLIKMF